jgi:hypothetical protein
LQDVLIRLGDEEDAVRAKAHEYERGAAAFVNKVDGTWTGKLNYERERLIAGLKDAQALIDPRLKRLGKDEKGKDLTFKGVKNVKRVEGVWRKRNEGLFEAIDALMVDEEEEGVKE